MYSNYTKINAPYKLNDPVNGKTYTKDIKLGNGAFSDVYKYVCKSENTNYAIKIMDMDSTICKGFGIKGAENEVTILKDYGNSYTCKFISSFINKGYFYIVMEYYSNGSLDTYTKMNGLLNEKEAVKIMLCILNALEHLHNNGVVHRDIKPGNILLNDMLLPQLADMGLSSKRDTKEEKRYHWCGTEAYMAPEVLNRSPSGYNYKADLWSLGVVVYKLVYGRYPNIQTHNYGDSPRTKKAEIKFHKNTRVSLAFKSLLGCILKHNPEERPTINDIRRHDYMMNFEPDELPNDVWKAIQNPNINKEKYPQVAQLLYNNKRTQAQYSNSTEKRIKTTIANTTLRTPKHTIVETIFSLPGLSKISGIKNIYADLKEICCFVNNDKTTLSLLILTLFKEEIPQYVKKWYNSTKKNGVVYELIGGNMGLLCKDPTVVLTYNGGFSNNTYIYKMKSHSVHQAYYADSDVYSEIAKNLLTRKSLLENYRCNALNKIQSQCKKVLLQKNCDRLHVSAFFRLETAVIFYFSSKNIQIIFNSGYTVLLSNKSRVFSLLYPSGLVSYFKTIEIEAYRIGLIKYKELHKADRAVVYLQLTKSVLQKTVEYIDNSN